MKRDIVRNVVIWALLGVALVSVVFMFGVFLVLTILRQNGWTMDDYLATHRSAATRLPIAVEFEKLFPGQTDHFITQYGFNRYGGDRTNTWNSEAYFGGRYSLTMQVEVTVDYAKRTITLAGEPVFYLEEITRVDGTSASYGGLHARFGEKEWSKAYQAGGNFSLIGLKLDTRSPVPHFNDFVNAMRRPRIPVTLLETNVQSSGSQTATNDDSDHGGKQ